MTQDDHHETQPSIMNRQWSRCLSAATSTCNDNYLMTIHLPHIRESNLRSVVVSRIMSLLLKTSLTFFIATCAHTIIIYLPSLATALPRKLIAMDGNPVN